MPALNSKLSAFVEKMKTAGLAPAVIETFSRYYRQVVDGETGLIPECDITPVPSEAVRSADTLEPFRAAGEKPLNSRPSSSSTAGWEPAWGLPGPNPLSK